MLPFDRFPGVDTLLGPEMRSTGEVMGVDITFGLAFAKSQMAAGTRLPDSGTVFLSLADRDKPAGLEVGSRLQRLGLLPRGDARHGRVPALATGVAVDTLVAKVGEEGVASDAVDLIAQGKVQLVVNTPAGPRAAGGRPAHPHGVGDLQGALPHHAGRRAGRGGGHGRRRGRTRSRCARCRTCHPVPRGADA